METPRLLSEYFAPRAQSACWTSAKPDVDAANRSKTISRLTLRVLKGMSDLYSLRLDTQMPAGGRAIWVVHASRVLVSVSRRNNLFHNFSSPSD